jgi:isopentenyl diphosphate isomerase/L-lactate dehydrogenase-like FMN-dependent dehydrogenase
VSFARPYLYGLAAGGEAGVRRALEIMAASVRHDMALLGARSVGEIDRSCVRAREVASVRSRSRQKSRLLPAATV